MNHMIPKCLPTQFPHTRDAAFFIEGPVGRLACLSTPAENAPASPAPSVVAPPAGVAVICHPDPRQEGTMHNKVVTMTARSFEQRGWATVRFNYRGVGESEGEYGDVVGEQQDCLAVIDWVRQVAPQAVLSLAGFSFGSYIAASVARQVQPQQLITIAPPVTRYPYHTLTDITCPWLVVQGDADQVVLSSDVVAWAAHPPSPLQLQQLSGVGHFFHGRLVELRDILTAFILSPSPRNDAG